MSQPREYAKSYAEAANALGVNPRTVREWVERGAPGKGEQGYDIEALRTWQQIHGRPHSVSGEDDSEDQGELQERLEIAKVRKTEGEARKVQAEADIKEFEAKQRTQDVVHLDDVEQFLALFFGEARRVIMRIPKEMKNGYPEAMRRDLEEDLEARLSIALRTISGYARRVSDIREGK
jgi:phage terminase Nu1 subunit (DNA packaging protein)